MSGGLRILIILVVMFVGIYFYSISYRYIRAAKQKKIRKQKLDKEEEYRQGKLKLQKAREEKEWDIELRRREIKRQFKWLEEMNKKNQNKNSLTQE